MRHKPESCAGCSCESHGTDFTQIEGTGASGVLCVGEASGEMEARDGLPFRPYAPAGAILERVLRRMGVDRQQLSVTNVLRCRPRNNWLEGAPWEWAAINQCRANLDRAVSERRPRAIVALGGTATRELTGLAGSAQGVTHLAGYVLPGPNGIPVVPTFHPAFLRRGAIHLMGVLARNLTRALNVAKGIDREWMWNVDPEVDGARLNYATRPSLEDAEAFLAYCLANPNLPISYDLETSESLSLDEDAREGFTSTQLQLVQFAIQGRGAIALHWDRQDLTDDWEVVNIASPFKRVIQGILHTPNVKCGHNVWLFDNKVLRAADEREGLDLTPRGVIHDTLAMFHHWQPDIPAHLQFAASFVQFPFPWKHLAATDLAFYGCCDVDATLRLYTMLERTLKRDGLWGDATVGYLGQVYEVRPVLAAMEDRGLPVDNAARLALGVEFEQAQAALGTELTGLAGGVGRVHPKEGYKGVPPEVKQWMASAPDSWASSDIPVPFDDGERYYYCQRDFSVAIIDDANGEPKVDIQRRWCRVYDFNPNSWQQLIAYMKSKRHPVPKDKHRENAAGENPDTTNAKELMRLRNKTGDLFYEKVIEYRGLTKLRGTYVDGFVPGPDGRVHTTFTFASAIAQLTSRNPNIQNFPKLKPTPALAKAMRKMVAARPGYLITEWDFKSCHVITLGFLAEDLNYMRLGRLDIHSFVAGHFLGLWDGAKIFSESDDELRARFKWLKANPAWKVVRDDQAKHGILGIGNGLKAKGLYERYMESFPPVECSDCRGSGRVAGKRVAAVRCPTCVGTGRIPGQRVAERVLETCQALFPKVFTWQEAIQKRAHDQQFLKTEFAHIRRFYEVFRWDHKRRDWGHGDQAEEAIAFWLANIAHAHMREKLKDLHRAGLDAKWGLFNTIHDSTMWEVPADRLDEHIADVYPILVAPSRVLRHPTICPDGLVIDVEGSAGPNWAEMEPIQVGVPA